MYSVNDKRFLSDKAGEDGNVSWHVYNEECTRKNKKTIRTDSDLYLRDCYKTITLEFGVWSTDNTKEAFQQRYTKIGTLIDSLEGFRLALKQAEEEVTIHNRARQVVEKTINKEK